MLADACPTTTDRYVVKDLTDELLLYDAEGKKFHVLNATMREIYLHCDGRHTVDDLAGILVAEFEVDGPTAKCDTMKVLEKLVDLQIVTSSEQASRSE